MGQLVSSLIQFTIGELLVFEDHRDGVRGFLYLGFEQFVNALGLWIIAPSAVEAL